MHTRLSIVALAFLLALIMGGCSHTRDCRGDERVCSLHHIDLANQSVPIRYGLIRYSPADLESQQRLFPNSRTWVGGGCVVLSDTHALVRSCPKCEDAERDWVRSQSAAISASITPRPQPPSPPPAPTELDLRPRLLALGLPPRPQGARGTCSIFTTCETIEFALAMHGEPNKPASRLSPEFVNWAAGQAAGRPSDGNFFHNALNGFDRLGVCTEEQMPYQPTFDAARAPSAEARVAAARIRDESRDGPTKLAIHWIVPWQNARFGVADEPFAEIKRVLASGYPVAAGSGHSRLLVGFHDDPAKPGGGTFITEDSALSRFDEVTYEFVRKDVADVFWVEAIGAPH